MRARNAYCSFCRKSYLDVGPLVEGPGAVYICGKCVESCQSMIVQENRRRQGAEGPLSHVPTPEILEERLQQLFLGQEEASKTLAIAAWNHYARAEKGNPIRALLVGPTRSSRLFLTRALAHFLKVPFVHGDAAKLIPAGSSEQLAESVLYMLLQTTGFDVAAAQRGVIYLDGIDQGEAQQGLLGILSDTAGDLLSPAMAFDATSLLIIAGGTFTGLDQTLAHQGRHPEQPITHEDLIAHGLHPDLARRFRVTLRLAPLNEETLVRLAAQWRDAI
jgi:ATP-dependent Clp protease ATP-binding subunit ClpX